MAKSEVEEEYIRLIREEFSKGNKEQVKNLLKELATKIRFPRLEEVLKEYDEYAPGKPLPWGLWGPENGLVVSGNIKITPCSPKKGSRKKDDDMQDMRG